MSDRIERAAIRLDRPELGSLTLELSRRFREGDPARIALRALDHTALVATADLLGSDRLPSGRDRLGVDRLIAALGLCDVAELRAAVEAIHGPVPDARAARAATVSQRAELWSWFRTEVAQIEVAIDAGWTDRVERTGIRDGPARHRARLAGALAVLRRLPADGTTLAALAADVLGDPHGLDRGRSVSRLVLDAIAGPTALDAETARAAWESVGVAPDELSSSVIVLGLRPALDHPFAAYLVGAADASEPVVLTLAQLRRRPFAPLPTEAVAFVVENPSVVAEAARAGWADGPVIICSSGRPTVAVLCLVRQLGAAGATVYQHADFDDAGLGITQWLAERAGTIPWRMDAESYGDATYEEEVRSQLLAGMQREGCAR